MTNDDDKRFFAWLDGELPPDEAAAVATEIGADPELARLADEHRRLNLKLRRAFDPIADAPVPESFREAVQSSDADVIDFARARRTRRAGSIRQWTALAATLAIGMFVGSFLPNWGHSPLESESGRIYAAGALGHALDTELASAPSGDVRIGLTYRTRSGEICRTFHQSASEGLACRKGDQWQIRGLVAGTDVGVGTYRMAAGMDPALAALVSSSMAGEPFNAAQERSARDSDWH